MNEEKESTCCGSWKIGGRQEKNPHSRGKRKPCKEACGSKKKPLEVIKVVNGITLTSSVLTRFWKQVDKNGPLPDQSKAFYIGLSKCWKWLGFPDQHGYGHLYISGRQCKAHRISYFIHVGPTKLSSILHKCDNPNCVNPDHLIAGTHKDNTQDMIAKGRKNAATGENNGRRLHPDNWPRGVNIPSAKLNDDKAVEIRRLFATGGISMNALAKAFGVSWPTINSVVKYKTWAIGGSKA